MRDAKGWSFLAAALFAVVTLFVFATFQDYGPESAIRRFQEAVRTGDEKLLQQVTKEPLDSESVRQLLRSRIGQVVARGYQPRIARSNRAPSEVITVVLYTLPPPYQMPWPVLWVVVKDKDAGGWKIDAASTLRATAGIHGGAILGYQRSPRKTCMGSLRAVEV